MYVPEELAGIRDMLRRLDVDSQLVHIDPNMWRQIIPDIDEILPQGRHTMISRHDIFDIAPREPLTLVPCTLAEQQELRRFFILVMIWGWGRDGRGINKNIAKMLASPGCPAILCQVSEECCHGMYLKAYETLLGNAPKIKGLRPAFATKYLYFYCRHFNATVRPLILDNRVIQSLRTYTWPTYCPDYVAHNTTSNDTRRSSGGYGQYLILLHNWADALACRPDQIEYYLWTRAEEIIR
jgi:hypothetical protein